MKDAFPQAIADRGGEPYALPVPTMTTAVMAAPLERAPRPSPWIVGPRFDLAFFLGSGLLGFSILGINRLIPSAWTIWLCALVSIVIDQTHVFHTFTRTYLDLAEFRRGRRFYVATAAVVFGTLCIVAALDVSYALSLVLYGAAWHQTKQHYGFVRLYDRRRPHSSLGAFDTWLDNFCLFGGILAGVLYIFRLPALGEVDRPLVYPHVPASFAISALKLVAAGFVAMAVREAYRYSRHGEVAWQKVGLISMAVALVCGAALLETELIVILVAVTSFHALQYIAITWLYNRNKYAGGVHAENRFTSRLIQRRWVWAYFGLGAVYGGIVVAMQRVDLLLPFAYTLTVIHFVVDARIWKVKYCPDLRENLRAPRPIPTT